MKRVVFAFLILFLCCQISIAAHIYREKEYQKSWCKKNGGIIEYKNPDKTRVDCLTEDYAVEFDFAEKWAESIGQALYYGLLTNKTSGIVLISEKGKKDIPYIKRAQILADKYNIMLWIIYPFEI